MLHHPRSRAKNPEPTHVDGTCHDSDYLSQLNGDSLPPTGIIGMPWDFIGRWNGGRFILSNSGVKVHRRNEVRFTCAKHHWHKVEDKAVYHSGRRVGTVTELLGEGIVLVTTNYPFLESIIGRNVSAKHLLHSSFLPFGGFVVIDSAYTSKQRM